MREADVAIIGAGIVGSAIARRLSRYDARIVLIDSADDVCAGASRANSAIVHAGYDCAPGSSMARLNVRGNALYDAWCAELDVPFERISSLVIAFNAADERELTALKAKGGVNGVPGLEIISGERARSMDPALNPAVTAALYAPTAGITCPYQLAIACAENARANGCEWLFNSLVTRITKGEDGYIEINAGEHIVHARFVINAAGVSSDEIARMAGDRSFAIKPRKGEYILLDRAAINVKHVIFQTPSPMGKGVLVSPTVDGNVFAGPTAVDQQDKFDTSVTRHGLDEIERLSLRSVPGLNLRSAITSFAGVRAQSDTGDFVIKPSETEPRFIHAAGICSPGLTSAPAIAEEVESLLINAGFSAAPKPHYDPHRKAIPRFSHMTNDERSEAIAADRRYGHIICRCETVTEAEIVDAIARGARSLDAVKRRTRAGMGRCQGGFCGPRVMEILARELGVKMTDLTKSGGQSYLLARDGIKR